MLQSEGFLDGCEASLPAVAASIVAVDTVGATLPERRFTRGNLWLSQHVDACVAHTLYMP